MRLQHGGQAGGAAALFRPAPEAAVPGHVVRDFHRVLQHDSERAQGPYSQLHAGLSADGTGIRICVCDTGIDTDHVMYSTRIDSAAGYDFHNDDSDPEDDNGHGAHVAGIAVGGTGFVVTHDPACAVDKPFQGMAPMAR